MKRKHLETTTKFGNIDAQVPTPRHPQVRHPQEPDKMSLCVSGFGRRIRTLDPGLTHPPQLDCPDAKGGNPDGTFSGPEVFEQRRQKPFILSRWGRYKQESIHIYIYIQREIHNKASKSPFSVAVWSEIDKSCIVWRIWAHCPLTWSYPRSAAQGGGGSFKDRTL